MNARVPTLVTCVLWFGSVSSAMAAFDAGDFHPTVSGEVINGNGANDDVSIAAVRLGLVHYFRSRLGFFTEAAVFRPTGDRGGRRVDTSALGCVFGLRWHVYQGQRVGLYTEWGMGFLVARDAFPPAGTRFNGTSHFGIGATVDVGDGLSAWSGLRQMHVSNGKGLVADNPSFDGLGGYAGLIFRPRDRPPFPPIGERTSFGGRDVRWRAETTLEFGDDDPAPGGGVLFDFPLGAAPTWRVAVSGTAAELVDELIWKGSVRMFRETNATRAMLGYSRHEFNVFTSDIYEFQLERTLNDASTVAWLLNYEEKNLADDRVYGGLFITTYPMPYAAIQTGVGFERQQHEFFDSIDNLNDAGFNIGVEVAPALLDLIGGSAFFTVGIGYDTSIAGLRFQPGVARALVDRHRRGALMIARP